MPMSEDAPQTPTSETPGRWLALTATQLGAAHQASGLPNQDAVAAHQIQDGLVAAVSDGHGHYRHFRSARGSELAAGVACQAAEELAARLDDFETAEQIESEVLGTLVPAITSRWRAAVRDDLAADPFTTEEEAARAPGDDALIAYGATLLLAIAWRKWLVLTQIGDGDVVCIRPDGRALLPVPGDPSLDGRQTTSLCGPRADAEFRAGVVNTALTPLLGVLLATDGYGNAQVADPWPDAVSADLAALIGDRQPEWLAQQLPLWASRCASADGSADDTTIALLIAPSAAALRRQEVLRQEEPTVPPAGELPAVTAPRTVEATLPVILETPAAREQRLAKTAAAARVEAPAGPGGDLEAARPAPDLEAARPAPDLEAARPAPDHEATRRAPDVNAAQLAPDVNAAQLAPDVNAARPGPDPGESRSAPDLGLPGQAPDHGPPGPAPDHGPPGPAPDHGPRGPAPDHRAPRPAPDHRAARPARDDGSPGPAADHGAPRPARSAGHAGWW